MLRAGSLRHAGDGDRPRQRKAGRSPPKPRKGGANQYSRMDKLEKEKIHNCELCITGGMPFLGGRRNMLDLGTDQKGLFTENLYAKQKNFGGLTPKIATVQKAPFLEKIDNHFPVFYIILVKIYGKVVAIINI